MSFRLFQDDALDVLRDLPDASVDAMVTDPPAGIAFMGKAWDAHGTRARFIADLQPIFEQTLRVLKPGAHGLVWALPRTSHWTATALEDAGFEIRDVVTHHFGSGFPKSLDVSKAIDKAAGAVREVVGDKAVTKNYDQANADARAGGNPGGYGGAASTGHVIPITAASTEDAKRWSGWGTALKPATEHWILVRKPLAEKNVAANVLAHGTGALNIDACRIHSAGSDAKPYTVTRLKPGATLNATGGNWRPEGGVEYVGETKAGRWPANLVLSHHPLCEIVGERIVGNHDKRPGRDGVRDGGFVDTGAAGGNGKPCGPLYGSEAVEVWDCIPGCAVALLDAQSGDLQSGLMREGTPRNNRMGYHGATSPNAAAEPLTRFDPGAPGIALTIVAPYFPPKTRPCAICGHQVYRKTSNGGTREHLGGRAHGPWSGCFRNPSGTLVAAAHQACNELRGAENITRFNRMVQWSRATLHPQVRRALPKGGGQKGEPPGRHVKRGQGAWK